MAKTWRYAVHKAEIGRHAARKGMSPSWKWIVVHVLSLSGLGFHHEVNCDKSEKQQPLFKTFILQKKPPSPFTQT